MKEFAIPIDKPKIFTQEAVRCIDSIVSSCSLSESLISNFKLDLLKFEHIFNEVVYLAPKVYAGIISEYDYIKVKGFFDPLIFE